MFCGFGLCEVHPIGQDTVYIYIILDKIWIKQACYDSAVVRTSLTFMVKPSLLDCRIDGETLKSFASHWPSQSWQEYEPLLSYCRDKGIRLVACGTPLEVIMCFL